MKELLQQHGFVPTALVILAIYNIVMTTVKTVIEKVDLYLAKNPKDSSLYRFADKSIDLVSSAIDYLTGNKEHADVEAVKPKEDPKQ